MSHNPSIADDESARKDAFFQRLGSISDEMIAAFGRDFAMGALVLAARFIAERGRADAGAEDRAEVRAEDRAEDRATSALAGAATEPSGPAASVRV